MAHSLWLWLEKLGGTVFESQPGQMFVIEVVHM